MSDDSVVIRFGGSIEALTSAVDAARGSIESLASPFVGVTSAATALGKAFATAFAVREIAAFGESMAELGTETIRASQILGVSTEEIGGLKLVAQASGGSLEELQTAFGRLSRNVIDETPNAKRALDALGLSFADIRNKTPEAQLELLASKFAGIKDGADKDAIAIELLGRAGVNLIPLFNEGADGFKRWFDAAKELDPAFARAAEAGHHLHESIVEMNAAIKGVKDESFLALDSSMEGAAMIVRDLASSFTKTEEAGGGMGAIIGGVAKSIVTLFAAVIAGAKELQAAISADVDEIAIGFTHLGPLIADVFSGVEGGIHNFFAGLFAAANETVHAIGQLFADLGPIIAAAFSLDASGAAAAFEQMKSHAVAAAATIGASWRGAFKDFDFSQAGKEYQAFTADINARGAEYHKDLLAADATFMKEWNTIWGDGFTAIETKNAQHQVRMAADGTGAKGDNDALETAKKGIDGEIKALQEGLSLKQAVWSGEVAAHKLSKEAELASLMAATEKEFQAELALLEKEKALQGQKPQAIQEINNKIEQLQAAHNLKMVKLDQDSLAEETASWQRFADTLTTTFNSQLKGLITGTTTFSKAFKSMLTDLTVKFVEVVENMVVKWAVGELAQTTATTTGAAARAAAQTASSTASDAGTLAAVFRSISASAAETFGGVFGFLSPVLGPAAAGPAAGAEATVLAAGGAIGGLAMGAWELPSDMLVRAHRGEMVVPAGVTPWAQGVISGAANTPGVNTVHVHHATNFNVTAMDARSFHDYAMGNRKTLLRAINEGVRNGAHLGLSKLSPV